MSNDNPNNPHIKIVMTDNPSIMECLPPELREMIQKDLGGGNAQPQLTETEQEPEVPKEKIKFDFGMVNCNSNLKDLTKKLKTSKQTNYGILLYGESGCHAKGEKILAYDGNPIKVENIKIGDKLMGPDSTPRTVLDLVRGKDNMYKITFNNTESITVNENHILAFYCLSKKYTDSKTHKRKKQERPWSNKHIEMSVKEYLNLPNSEFKKSLRLYFPEGGIDFKQKHDYGNLPPYLLGLLLGDGCLRNVLSICTADIEIANYIKYIAKKTKLSLTEYKKPNGKAVDYHFVNSHETGGVVIPFNARPISKELNDLKLWNTTSPNKFIPNLYLTGTKKERLELLAGLLDTDGCLIKTHKTLKSGEKRIYYTYDFTTKSYQLFIDVKKLCRSLGFKVNVSKSKTMKKIAKNTYTTCNAEEKELEFYRLTISGNITEIPIKIERKKAPKNNELKEGLKTSFKIEKLSKADYYGFKLDKDHLYVMDNYLVTHNCGKSYFGQYLAQELGMPIIKKRASDLIDKFVGQTERNIKEAFKEAKQKKAVLLFDEADSFLFDRKYAQRDFECTSTNELLTQMEDHPYPFIMTTNLKEKIDKASLRRFLFKIKYDYMTENNIVSGVKTYFGKEFGLTKEQLKELKYITAGDFKIAKRKMDVLENSKYTNEKIYEYLLAEQDEKDINVSESINI